MSPICPNRDIDAESCGEAKLTDTDLRGRCPGQLKVEIAMRSAFFSKRPALLAAQGLLQTHEFALLRVARNVYKKKKKTRG
jgi:hypothetical protein